MKSESLNRGKKIQEELEKLRKYLKEWENAIGWHSWIHAETPREGYTVNDIVQISPKYAPFDVVKIMSIDGFKKEIASLEEEFENL